MNTSQPLEPPIETQRSDLHIPNAFSQDVEGAKEVKGNEGDNAQPPVPYSVFSSQAKRSIVAMCAIAGFFSPFSAFTYFPALEYMAEDLGVSLQLMNLTITMFLVVQGIVPAVLGDLADQIGRRPTYLLVLVVYFAACVGLALQRSYPALLILRMLQSAGSSGTISLGIMVVADLAPPHSRGHYVGAMLSGYV
jgi:MFS family permease